MSPRPALSQSMVYSTLSQGSNGFLLLLVILAGRLLGDTAFGQFAFAQAFVATFMILTDFGTETVFIRDVARDRDRAPTLFGALVSWKLVLSAVTLGLIMVTARGVGITGVKLLLIDVLAVSLVMRSLKWSVLAVCRAFEAFNYDAALSVIERFMLLAVGVVVLMSGGGLVGLAMTFLVVRVVNVIAAYLWLHWRVVRVRLRWNWPVIWTIQRAAIPIGVALIAEQCHGQFEILFLGWLRSDAEVGWYAAAIRLIEVLTVVPTILYTVFLPRLSALSQQPEAHSRLSLSGMRVMAALAIPIAAVVAWLAPWLIRFVFGPGFQEGGIGLRILAFGLPFGFVNAVLLTALLSLGYQRVVLALTAVGLTVGLSTCLLAIPHWGLAGAAVANILSQAIYCTVGLILLSRLRQQGTAGRVAPAWMSPTPGIGSVITQTHGGVGPRLEGGTR